ncbi:MAG: hypothetical protein H0T56_02965 [Pseudaminobacter sp.]|nr:hypothetical protein [Pseudaminobacter sp.]
MAKKATAKSGKAVESKAGAGPAMAKRSKDAKPAPSPKKAPPAAKAGAKSAAKSAPAKGDTTSSAKSTTKSSAKPAKPKSSSSEGPSLVTKVMRKVKATADGAVALASSVMGKDDKKSKAKRG